MPFKLNIEQILEDPTKAGVRSLNVLLGFPGFVPPAAS
jgi:hypothetical protein